MSSTTQQQKYFPSTYRITKTSLAVRQQASVARAKTQSTASNKSRQIDVDGLRWEKLPMFVGFSLLYSSQIIYRIFLLQDSFWEWLEANCKCYYPTNPNENSCRVLQTKEERPKSMTLVMTRTTTTKMMKLMNAKVRHGKLDNTQKIDITAV